MQTDIESQVQGFFAFTDIGSLVSTLVNVVIVIAALITLAYLLLGGFNWITSGGDKAKTEEAQKKITNAIIGLIIVVAAFAVFNVVRSFLGLEQAITTP